MIDPRGGGKSQRTKILAARKEKNTSKSVRGKGGKKLNWWHGRNAVK